ncbi:MAG: hypothetical protein R2711_04135 [Acidimicrobiales bacterium]
MQLKAIFSRYRWNGADARAAADSYRNDHSKMVVQLAQPCAVHHKRRARSSEGVA